MAKKVRATWRIATPRETNAAERREIREVKAKYKKLRKVAKRARAMMKKKPKVRYF